MEKIYFVTDLDRTIIHAKNIGYKCVEKIGDREITYMTEKAYIELAKLLKVENFIFVPCTMRNIYQTLRVDFIREYEPEIIICCNGGQVYVNGQLDKQWNTIIAGIVDNEKLLKDICYLERMKEKHKYSIEITAVRNIDNLYIEIKAADSNEATRFYDLINGRFEEKIRVIQIKAKIFIIDKRINKSKALDYIVDKYKIKNLFTSGDSIVDKEFTSKGISILPKHATFEHSESIITDKSGIQSTEDILDYIKKMVII